MDTIAFWALFIFYTIFVMIATLVMAVRIIDKLFVDVNGYSLVGVIVDEYKKAKEEMSL